MGGNAGIAEWLAATAAAARYLPASLPSVPAQAQVLTRETSTVVRKVVTPLVTADHGRPGLAKQTWNARGKRRPHV